VGIRSIHQQLVHHVNLKPKFSDRRLALVFGRSRSLPSELRTNRVLPATMQWPCMTNQTIQAQAMSSRFRFVCEQGLCARLALALRRLQAPGALYGMRTWLHGKATRLNPSALYDSYSFLKPG
jgi:hypothetical protein